MSDFRKVEDQRYISTLFAGLAKQKEVTIALHYNNHQVYAQLAVTMKGKQTFTIVSGGDLPVALEENVRISLFYKEIFFIIESEVSCIHEDSFEIKIPDKVYASYRRLVNRYKPQNSEEATIGQFGTDRKFHLVDISTQGLAFIADERCFEENETVRNMVIRFAGGPEICLDTIVKHITKQGEDKYFYGTAILSIEWHTYQKLFKYIFESSYPYFRLFETFSGDQIMKLYEEARFLHLKPRDGEDELFIKSIRDLDQVKDKPLIASNLVYQKNNKLIAVGSALRVYNRSFLGKPLVMMAQVRLNPKAKTDIYIGLADYLLNHPYFQNYLAYIEEDYEWHHEILTSAAEIVNDSGKLQYETVCCWEYGIDANKLQSAVTNGRKSTSVYACDLIEKPDGAFFEFCHENLSQLEVECYGLEPGQFNLDELSQIYQAYGFDMVRKLWRINRGNITIGYALAECYSDVLSRTGNLDSCKLFFAVDNVDIETVMEELLPQLEMFYGVRRKSGFSMICRLNSAGNSSVNIPGLNQKRIGRVLMDREGLSEYKKLLLANFEYYSKYFPLTYPQKGIWYLEKMYPGTSIGNVAGTERIKEVVNYQLLVKAINIFILQNEGMRLRIVEDNGLPRQFVKSYQYYKPDFLDFSKSEPKELFHWEEDQTSIPFDLKDNDLFYFAVLKFSDNEGGFYIKTHHTISDAWSMGILGSQIIEIYDKLKRGQEYFKEKKPSYIDYILSEEEYLYTDKFEKDRNFWNGKFDTLPESVSIKPRKYNLINPITSRKTFMIEKSLAKKIRTFCNKIKTSPFSLFISVLIIYINRISSSEDLVFGTPILNRANAKEKETAGMFISTVPFRFSVNTETDFISLIQQVTHEWMILLKHQRYPYELILKEFRERNKVTENLYDVIFSYQNTQFDKDFYTKFTTRWHFNGYQQESLCIHIADRDDEGVYIINFDYLDDYFTVDEVGRFYEHFTILLEDSIENPTQKINRLEIMSSQEKNQILFDFNDTITDYPVTKTLCDLFEEQVERTPDNIAVIFENQQLTYRELNERSNQLARFLRNKGVKADSIVGIMVERSLEMIIGIFGIIKSGGAYLPIDPSYPKERISFMLDDSSAEIILFCHVINKELYFNKEIVDLEDQSLFHGDKTNLNKINNSRNLAYVIYTSGSTGKPKGVMIEHHSIVNRLIWMQKKYPIYEKDVILQKTPFTFDVSVWEIFWWSHQGSMVCLLTPGGEKDPDQITRAIKNKNVTVMHFVPSMLNLFLDFLEENRDYVKRLVGLQQVFASGEALNLQQVERFNRILFKTIGTKLSNLYGPTEAAVDVSYFDCSEHEHFTNIPIGKPIDNINLFIVDKNNQLQPIGVPGELLISGVGLARGYLNRPELTAERFILHPFKKDERAYKTGDLTKWLGDGNIEYLGRMDNQVKIRGFRIELGEIETVLLKHKDIREATVLVKELNVNKFLCAYIVANRKLSLSELRGFVLKELPDYMIPSHFIQIEKLPLSLNGKIDRKALLKIPVKIETGVEFVNPRNNTEEMLQKICQEVLNIENIGMTDNLIEIGADSLSLMRIQTIVFSKGWNLSFQDFYQFPTIAEIAAKIDGIDQENKSLSIKINENEIAPSHSVTRTEMATTNEDGGITRNVLLTGVTGYLGIHILNELLINTDSKVFCLIRGKDNEHANNRLIELLDNYQFNEHQVQINKRIFILKGDLTLDQFGLTKDIYHQFGLKIDLIIHAAALVKHYGNYMDFEKINVDGTKKIIEFACYYGKKLNYISTTSILEHIENTAQNTCCVSENDFYIGKHCINHVYIRSKFEAENEVLRAMKKGLKAQIFRVGNLTERYSDGKFQINAAGNLFHILIKSIMEIGLVPEYLLEKCLEFTPVDLCSQAIVKLAFAQGVEQLVFHIFNHNYIKLKEYLSIIKDFDIHVQAVNCSLEEYINIILLQDNKPLALNFFVEQLKQEYQSNNQKVEITSNITREYLNHLDFFWPKIDSDYILKTKDSFKYPVYSIV